MSRLAGEFIRSQFTLPRRCEVIESDLSNGYLFLAMLSQLGKLSEEEFERASDDVDPDVVLANYHLLAKALRAGLDIRITQTDVANIVSETPGAAASLVMKIKRWNEASLDKKYSRAPDAYKKMISTQRPKEFEREKTFDDTTTPKDKFLHDARTVLNNGVFSEIDMKCLLQKYETHSFEIDEAWQKKRQAEKKSALEVRQVKHDATATRRLDTQSANSAKDQGITERWKKTLETKTKRQVRDLQFELATLKIATLRRRNKNNELNEEQIAGFDAFEANMKRSGLGGNDDSGNMSVSYETTDNFVERLGDEARKRWPSNEDTNDFVTQLQVRTATNRQARYEKARRKRRMLVEQAASNAASTLSSVDEEGAAGAAAEAAMLATRQFDEKLKRKEAHMEEVMAMSQTSRERINEEFEKSLEALSASVDERREEIMAQRAQALEEVRLVRDAKKAAKREQSTAVCNDVVGELVGDLFEGGRKPTGASEDQEPLFDFADDEATSLLLLELAKQQLDSGFAPSPLLEELLGEDSWLPYATLGSEAGMWGVREVSAEAAAAPVPALASAPAPAPEAEAGEGEEMKEDNGTSEAAAAPEEGNQHPAEAVVVPEPVYEVVRSASFLETAQTVTESIVQSFASSSSSLSSAVPPAVTLSISQAAESALQALDGDKGTDKTIVVLVAAGTTPPLSYWQQMRGWANDRLCLWDAPQAIAWALLLAPLLEGKKPTINFPSLLNAFCVAQGLDPMECPAELCTAALAPEMLAHCKEALTLAGKVMKTQESLAIDSDKAINAATAGFSDYSLSMLLGQTLCLRAYLRAQLGQYMDCVTLPSQLSGLVVTTRMFGASAGRDSAINARIIDHYLQGGSTTGVPEDEAELGVAIASEAGVAKEAGGGGKKAAKGKKGAVEEAPPPKQSAIASVFWISSSASSSAVADVKAAWAATEEQPAIETARAVLDCYALTTATTTASSASTEEDGEAAAAAAAIDQVDRPAQAVSEMYLARYGQRSPPAVGSPEAEVEYVPGAPLVPVYRLSMSVAAPAASHTHVEGEQQQPQEHAAVEEEKKADEDDADANADAVPAVAPTPTPLAIANYTAMMEGVLAGVVDSVLCPPPSEQPAAGTPTDDAKADAAVPPVAPALPDPSTRLMAVVEATRQAAPVASKMWLLHAVGIHPLDVEQAYTLHSTLCDMRARSLKAVGILGMAMGTTSAYVEKEVQRERASLARNMKTADPRWYQLCSDAAQAQKKQKRELTEDEIETLVCRLGTVIDDRHMHWLNQVSSFRASGQKAVSELTGRLELACSLLVHMSAAVVAAQADAVDAFVALFGTRAGYISLPWSSASAAADSGREMEPLSVETKIDSVFGPGCYANVVGAMDDTTRAAWDVALASTTSPSSTLGESVRATMTQEVIKNASRLIAAAQETIRAAAAHLEAELAESAASVRVRYDYEHTILSEWRKQMTADPQGPAFFLHQFHFGVSADPSHDGVAWIGEPDTPVDLGDMGLPLSTVRALAEAVHAAIDLAWGEGAEAANDASSFSEQQLESPALGNGNNNNSTLNMSLVDGFAAAASAASRQLVSSVSALPHGWKNQARVKQLVTRVITCPTDKEVVQIVAPEDRREALAGMSSELVLALLYATLPCLPPLSYCAGLYKLLASREEGPNFSIEDALVAIGNTPSLCYGWWAGEETDSAKEITHTALAAVLYACATASGRCNIRIFFLALCKAPSKQKCISFAGHLLAADATAAATKAEQLSQLSHMGVYRALSLASALSPANKCVPADYEDYSESTGSADLNTLLGPTVTSSAIAALLAKCKPYDDYAVLSLSPDVYRAGLAFGKKVKPVPPVAVAEEEKEKKQERDDEGEGEGEGEGEEKKDEPTAEAVTEAVPDPLPEPEPVPEAVEQEVPEVWAPFVLQGAGMSTTAAQAAWSTLQYSEATLRLRD
jgi:hypothetical protein